VTGIDISEDMVEIARERVEGIPGHVAPGLDPMAEFHAMEVVDIPWSDRFDAAVMFDTMHHFDDELETLRVVLRSLVPGGRLYIREGARPAPGSEAEQNLIQEMREHSTLESPFEPGYLVDVARRAGFDDVRLLLEIDELVALDDLRQPLRFLRRFLRYRSGQGDMNTLIARKPVGLDLETTAANFAARIELVTPWHESPSPNERLLGVTVTNTGRAFWPAGSGFPFSQGVVTVGLYAPARGGRDEIARATLPHGVSPGGSAHVAIRAPADAVAGRETRVDIVREGLAWFGDLGSEPLVVPAEG
jgi:SAM-dependent methyltransferase